MEPAENFPRNFHPPVLLGLLFRALFPLMGWIFLGFGWIFVLALGIQVDFSEVAHRLKGTVTFKGTLISSEASNFSENGQRVFRHAIRYSVGDKTVETICYGNDTDQGINRPITIEAPRGFPYLGRMVGCSRGPFSWPVLLVTIFPAIGLILVIYSIPQGLTTVNLYLWGRLSPARITQSSETAVRINHQTVMNYAYQFVGRDGATYSGEDRTHLRYRIEDRATEWAIYLPGRESHSRLVDALPCRFRVDPLRGLVYQFEIWDLLCAIPVLIALLLFAVTPFLLFS